MNEKETARLPVLTMDSETVRRLKICAATAGVSFANYRRQLYETAIERAALDEARQKLKPAERPLKRRPDVTAEASIPETA